MDKIIDFQALGIMPTTLQYATLRDAGWWSKANLAAVDTWASRGGDGSLHRFGVAAKVTNDDTVKVRLDTREDWRDRVLLVEWAVGFPSAPSAFTDGFSPGFGSFSGLNQAPVWPGLSEQLSFTQVGGSRLMITGPGASGPVSAKPDYGIELAPGLYLYADSLQNGYLTVNGDTNLEAPSVGLIIMVHAHDPLGIDRTAPALSDPVIAGGEHITPGALNSLQDGALMEQFNAWDPPIDPTDGGAVPTPDSMPLGPKVRGANPGIPYVWEPRRRDGVTDAAQTWHRRQRMAGGERRRALAATVATNNSVTLDDSFDWRDRVVHLAGRYSNTAAFLAGDSDDGDYGVQTAFSHTFYSWVGKDEGVAPPDNRHQATLLGSLSVFADENTGELVLRNDTGSTYTVSMILDASPPLGPRTVHE